MRRTNCMIDITRCPLTWSHMKTTKTSVLGKVPKFRVRYISGHKCAWRDTERLRERLIDQLFIEFHGSTTRPNLLNHLLVYWTWIQCTVNNGQNTFWLNKTLQWNYQRERSMTSISTIVFSYSDHKEEEKGRGRGQDSYSTGLWTPRFFFFFFFFFDFV